MKLTLQRILAWFLAIDRKKEVIRNYLYGHASSRVMFHVSGIRSCSPQPPPHHPFGVIAKPISRTHLFAYHSILVTRPAHVKLGFSDILFRDCSKLLLPVIWLCYI